MKVIAFNGSPRKTWNTATLLQRALDGAASVGAETELVHLYDLKMTGCKSCFSCKLAGGKNYGKHCVIKDDLYPYWEKIENADAIILGSPIYIGNLTSQMRGLIERLLYPYAEYDANHTRTFPKTVPVGIIYTMNVSAEQFKTEPYGLSFVEDSLALTCGPVEKLYSFETFQFTDYSKYVCPIFDPEERARIRKERWPIDCQNAFEMGARLAQFNQK